VRSMAESGRAMTWSGRRAVLMLDVYAFMLVTVPVLKIKTMSMKLLVLNALTDCNTVLLATIPLGHDIFCFRFPLKKERRLRYMYLALINIQLATRDSYIVHRCRSGLSRYKWPWMGIMGVTNLGPGRVRGVVAGARRQGMLQGMLPIRLSRRYQRHHCN
jgi:hypothetical protein